MIEQSGSGFYVKGRDAYLHILFYSDNIVRFVYSREAVIPVSTVAVVAEPVYSDAKADGKAITSPVLNIEVNPETLAVTVSDKEGTVISEDSKVLLDQLRVEKKLLWEKSIYGNGEKYTWLNQLGCKTANYNSDVLFHEPIHHPLVEEMHTSIPFYIGASPARAYGIYFDNSYRTRFDFAATDRGLISFDAEGGNLDYYLIYGPSIPEVVQAYCHLTGKPSIPAKKYLGFHQSRYSYKSSEEILTIAEKMRQNRVPCDVLYLDIDHTDGYKVFTVNSERFSNFRETLRKLKTMGFAITVIVNPGVKVEKGYRVYEEGKEKGYFVTNPDGTTYEGEVWPKPAVFPDYLRLEVRQWWGEFYRELLAEGVDAIWNDMNEPANFTLDSGTLPDDALHRTDKGKPVPHRAVHNIYGLLQTMATREALEKIEPDKRPFVLTRAAFSGSQRYSALWTGDNASVWEHLEGSIPMLLNLGLSGLSFVGADVGGYRGDCSGEMLIRWTQLGAFYPYFRNHTEIDTAAQEPWEFGPEVLSTVRKYTVLRYSLSTYIYNLMRENSLTGAPVMRPLVYHHGDDLQVYSIYDQFLLGEGLMVCPVCRPGATSRQVYLPEGTWYDYWTEEKLEGPVNFVAEAPLDHLPIYIKAGTLLPVDSFDQVVNMDDTGKRIDLCCYAGRKGRARLYFDDGESLAYRTGQFSEVDFTLSEDPGNPEVKEEIIKQGYPVPEINIKIIGGK